MQDDKVALLTKSMGLRHHTESLYKGPCPDCGENDFWLRTVGPNKKAWCNGCGYKNTLLSLGAEYGIVGVGWDEPDPPGPGRPLPFPIDKIPDVLKDHAKSVSASTQSDVGMSGMFSLLGVSAMSAGKWVPRPSKAWTKEHLCLYGVGIARSGERKSPMVHLMAIKPITAWEAEQERIKGPEYLARKDTFDMAEQRLQALKKKYANGTGIGKGKNIKPVTHREVEDARFKLEEARDNLLPEPRILIGDATIDKAVERLGAQGGRGANFSAEGGLWNVTDGRWSEGKARLEELNQAWAGEPLDPQRLGRATQKVENPALTMGVTIQPSVLNNIKNSESMRGEGFFARHLWMYPPSMVGYRKNSGEAPVLDKEAEARYTKMLFTLGDFDPEVPVDVHLTDSARQALNAYEDRLEEGKRPNGALREIVDLAEKAHGNGVRIATEMALAEMADQGHDLHHVVITGQTMLNAIDLMDCFLSHGQKGLSEVGQSDQQYVWAKVLELEDECPEGEQYTMRDLDRKCQKKGFDKEKLAEIVGELAHRNCIRIQNTKSGGRGRPAQVIQLHPHFRKTHDENDKNNSVISVSPKEEIKEEIEFLAEVGV